MTQYEDENDDYDGADCVVCGAMIPENSDHCVKCGWTWKSSGQNAHSPMPEQQVLLDLELQGPGRSSQQETFEPSRSSRESSAQKLTHERINPRTPMPLVEATGPNPAALIIGLILCGGYYLVSTRKRVRGLVT